MQTPAARIVAGLGAAAAWGVLIEAAAGLLLPIEITRAARLGRMIEMGAFTAGAALALTALCGVVPALRRRLLASPVGAPSAFGLAAGAALTLAFLWSPPDLSEVRLSMDPLRLRAGQAAAGALLALLVAAAGLAFSPPAWLHRVQAAATALAAALLLAPSAGGDGRDGRPDVFLISIDTLRADHLGCYGYDPPTSPSIDRLCAESVVYDAAMAAAAATIPSYTSLMSGTLQNHHAVYTNFDKADTETVMLAERLRDAGWTTAALLEGTFPGSFANVGQGFERLVQRGITAAAPALPPSEGLRSVVRGVASFAAERLGLDWSVTTRVTAGWLRSLPEDVPVLAHFYWPYPHDPYTPPARYRQLVPARQDIPDADIRRRVHDYDAEIRFTDVQVGAVLDALREVGRYDEAWIVFTSDHGEELGRVVDGEEGEGPAPFFGHSRYLFDTSVRVPLLVKPPRSQGIAPAREPAVVTTASVASSLLRRLGVEGADGLVGPLPGLGVPGPATGLAFSVARNPSRSFDRASVRRGAWRLIETRNEPPGIALYRHEDGSESPDLAAAEPETTRELRQLLHALHPSDAAGADRPESRLSDRELRMLEELGYVE